MQTTLCKPLILCGLVLALGGCSSGMSLLSGKGNVPSASAVPVGNNLAMPPDLSLATPTATSDAYQPNGYVAPVAQPVAPAPVPQPTQLASTAPAANNIYGSARAAPGSTGDVFDQAGISKFKPDGKKKTAAELNKELSAYYIAKKKAANPSYGTIGNVGGLFSHDAW